MSIEHVVAKNDLHLGRIYLRCIDQNSMWGHLFTPRIHEALSFDKEYAEHLAEIEGGILILVTSSLELARLGG